jgi:hypothetical protein
MALTPAVITQNLMTYRSMGVPGLNGPAFQQFASGLGNGVALWAVGQPQNLSLTGLATGTVGAGTITAPTTRLSVVPRETAVLGALAGFGVQGPAAAAMATVVAIAIAQVFTVSGQYQGIAAGVGTGQDVSTVTVANMGTLATILMGTLAGAFGATGPALTSWAAGLAAGVATLLLGSTGTGTVVGTAGPAPASGPTTSVVI